MMAFVTPGLVLLLFFIVAAFRLLVFPLIREWPEDQPETRRLPRLDSPAEFLRLVSEQAKGIPAVTRIPGEVRLSPQLKDKLRLVVSGATECALLSYLYKRAALQNGMPQELARDLLAGRFEGVASGDTAALVFARQLAVSRGETSQEDFDAVSEAYGPTMAVEMERFLKLVHFCALCSNTVHYYERGPVPREERSSIYLAYLLARPVSWFMLRKAVFRETYGRKPENREDRDGTTRE